MIARKTKAALAATNAGIPPSSARELEAAYQPESHATRVKSKLCDQDCAQVLRNLKIGTQFQDSENAQRNLEIAQIPKLCGTYILQAVAKWDQRAHCSLGSLARTLEQSTYSLNSFRAFLLVSVSSLSNALIVG